MGPTPSYLMGMADAQRESTLERAMRRHTWQRFEGSAPLRGPPLEGGGYACSPCFLWHRLTPGIPVNTGGRLPRAPLHHARRGLNSLLAYPCEAMPRPTLTRQVDRHSPRPRRHPETPGGWLPHVIPTIALTWDAVDVQVFAYF
jgi:hypothetical protein